MKQVVLYLILFTYASSLVKPVFPYLSDTTAHMFWNQHHLATVHFEHGKYHVHEEISASVKKNLPEKNNLSKKEISADEHLSPQPIAGETDWLLIATTTAQLQFSLASNSVNGDDPPPKMN